MSCSVNVLTTIKDYRPEDFQGEEKRFVTVKELKEALESNIFDDYSGVIDYFKGYMPDLSCDSDDFILGCERPDYLKAYVKNWNLKICGQCANQLSFLENVMVKEGYSSLSAFIMGHVDEIGQFKGVDYPASIYELRRALDTLDNHFSYDGATDIVYIADGDMVYNQIYMPKELLQDICRHPEKYMLINLVYE